MDSVHLAEKFACGFLKPVEGPLGLEANEHLFHQPFSQLFVPGFILSTGNFNTPTSSQRRVL
eukprot:1450511-Rhodomonas_salina.1